MPKNFWKQVPANAAGPTDVRLALFAQIPMSPRKFWLDPKWGGKEAERECDCEVDDLEDSVNCDSDDAER